MKEYVCSVCGYVHKTDGELPKDFKCPLCGAGKDAFKLKEDVSQKTEINLQKPHTEKREISQDFSRFFIPDLCKYIVPQKRIIKKCAFLKYDCTFRCVY